MERSFQRERSVQLMREILLVARGELKNRLSKFTVVQLFSSDLTLQPHGLQHISFLVLLS